MKNILCFGDSNTWGFTPGTHHRYPEDVRWTGVLSAALGSGYRVLEDGLNGRTTVYDDPCHPGMKGSEQLLTSLRVQKPLDLLILSLGTNDLKFVNAISSARGMDALLRIAKGQDVTTIDDEPAFLGEAKILVVSPILVGKELETQNPRSILAYGYEESKKFAKELQLVCTAHHVDFLDAALYASPSKMDCVHMTPGDHHSLGLAIADKVIEILG